MQNRLIRSGVWEIENFRVERDQSTGTWWIHDGEGVPLAEVVSLNAAREWIASDLDNIDLGMHPGGETR